MPAIEPKISPLTRPYPEVFGSMSIKARKNQLTMPKGFIFAMANSGVKNIRNPAI